MKRARLQKKTIAFCQVLLLLRLQFFCENDQVEHLHSLNWAFISQMLSLTRSLCPTCSTVDPRHLLGGATAATQIVPKNGQKSVKDQRVLVLKTEIFS